MTNQNTNDYLEKIKWVHETRFIFGVFVCFWPERTENFLELNYSCVASYRQRLFENLRMLPHAPGVQMQAIPEDAVQEDSGDEEDDPNKRISSKIISVSSTFTLHQLSGSCYCGEPAAASLNAHLPSDKRPVRAHDKRIACEEEFSDSEDEGEGGRRNAASYKKAKRTKTEGEKETEEKKKSTEETKGSHPHILLNNNEVIE